MRGLRFSSLLLLMPCCLLLLSQLVAVSGWRLLAYSFENEESGTAEGLYFRSLVVHLRARGHKVDLESFYKREDLDSIYDAVLTYGDTALDFVPVAEEKSAFFVAIVHKLEDLNPVLMRPSLLVYTKKKTARMAREAGLYPGIPSVVVKTPVKDNVAALEAKLDKLLPKREACPSSEQDGALTPSLAPAPALGLVMILKNEAQSIAQTLQSIKPHVDFWTVVDTGSSDETKGIVAREMEGVPGQLLEQPFEDFAATRNWALRAHGQKTGYAFMLDADYIVKNTHVLHAAARRMMLECADDSSNLMCRLAIALTMDRGGTEYTHLAVFPTADIGTEDGWRYMFPVHEVPVNTALDADIDKTQDHMVPLPGVVEEFIGDAASKKRSEQRMRDFDLPILQKENEKDPHQARIAFYLARTLYNLGMHEDALKAYTRRAALGGWVEEVFQSLLGQARILHRHLGRDPVAAYRAAAESGPHRAEPLLGIAQWHDAEAKSCKEGTEAEEDAAKASKCAWHHAEAYRYALEASEKPLPDDKLFIDTSSYGDAPLRLAAYHAWYVAKDAQAGKRPKQFQQAFDTGLRIAEKLAEEHGGDFKQLVALYKGLISS